MTPARKPHPQPIDYLECARMDIRGNSYLSGDKMVVDMDDVDDVIRTLKAERTHTPAAQAAEYTIEQIAEIDNRIRKERKAEREQVLDELILMIKRKEGCGYIFMDGPRFFTMIESLRGGATDEVGERR